MKQDVVAKYGLYSGWPPPPKRHPFDRWKTAVVESLKDSRRRGLSFEWAWRRAMHEHPPAPMLLGPRVPSMEDGIPVLEHFRTACRDAWEGRSPGLVDLPEALEGLGDGPAMKRRRGRLLPG